MKVLVSPAKKMREDGDFLPPKTVPVLLERARVLADWLRGLDRPALKKVLACNDAIVELNYRRYQELDFRRADTPALLAYDGIQYKYMAPQLFTTEQFAWAEGHLRILSGLYGVLRPFDGVVPYRLEMGARFHTPFCTSLYDFWGDSLYRALAAEGDDTLVDLSSCEYSWAVRHRAEPCMRVIDVSFRELEGGRPVEKGVYLEVARGARLEVRGVGRAGRSGGTPDHDSLGYAFSPEWSEEDLYVFLQESRPGRRP